MRNMLIVGAAAAAALMAVPGVGRAQAPQMSALQFPRGSSSITLRGRATPVGRAYTFRARRGQAITLHLRSRDGGVGANLIRYPGDAEVAEVDDQGDMIARAPATGGYMLFVYKHERDEASEPYTLTLSIR